MTFGPERRISLCERGSLRQILLPLFLDAGRDSGDIVGAAGVIIDQILIKFVSFRQITEAAVIFTAPKQRF